MPPDWPNEASFGQAQEWGLLWDLQEFGGEELAVYCFSPA